MTGDDRAMRPSTLVVSLTLCVAAMAAIRWHTYDQPLEMDAATYAVIAREMRAGRSLYTDLWDHKPPAVHVTFAAAQVVAGSGPAHVFLLGLGAAVVALLGVHAAATALAGRRVGLVAALFWTIIGADLGLQANQPNTEAFINAALVCAFALLVAMPVARRALGRAVAVGGLLALATLYKHVAAIPGVALLAAHVLSASGSPVERRRALGQVAVAGAVVALAWAAVALYFALGGRFDDFWAAVITFNQQYAGSPWRNLADGMVLDRLVPPALYPVLPLIALTLLGLMGGDTTRRARTMLAAYAMGAGCAVALPGHFLIHYYQLWLPVLSVGAAVGLSALRPPRLSETMWLARGGAVGSLLLLAVELPSLAVGPEDSARQTFGERLVRNVSTARAVDAVLLPDETFFEWGHEAELYYYSGRRPPAGEFRCEHLLHGPREAERTARLLTDLGRARPELVLVSLLHPFPLDHPVPRWLLAHYADADPATRRALATPDYRVLIRRDGALEQRLRERAVVAAADQ